MMPTYTPGAGSYIGHIGIEEIQLVDTNRPACGHPGGARLYAKLIRESVEWNVLGLASSTKRNIGRNGVLVSCVREDSASFRVRADARGSRYFALVRQT